ncbi:hypothetical protein ACS86_16225 [Vibrio alginolyticus]|nr:hypothetical protein ACS86_16225 [Vibrio alginolyticus]
MMEWRSCVIYVNSYPLVMMGDGRKMHQIVMDRYEVYVNRYHSVMVEWRSLKSLLKVHQVVMYRC